ncbi:hypothetical protein X975_04638, partial [Stegodyphus mimosarum]
MSTLDVTHSSGKAQEHITDVAVKDFGTSNAMSQLLKCCYSLLSNSLPMKSGTDDVT